MGSRKVTILEPAVAEVANIAFFIEGKGLPSTAKKFVDEAFSFFHKLSDERVVHKLCRNTDWFVANYRCANFKKKYVVAYLENSDEIIVCEFAVQKLLR